VADQAEVSTENHPSALPLLMIVPLGKFTVILSSEVIRFTSSAAFPPSPLSKS